MTSPQYPRGVSKFWPLEGVLKIIIASFALLLVNHFSLVFHSIPRQGLFSRKSHPSFQILRTFLFPLQDKRYFYFFLLPTFLFLPSVLPALFSSWKRQVKEARSKRPRLLNQTPSPPQAVNGMKRLGYNFPTSGKLYPGLPIFLENGLLKKTAPIK